MPNGSVLDGYSSQLYEPQQHGEHSFELAVEMHLVASKPLERAGAAELLHRACALGLEGVVATRAGSRYRGEQTDSWMKVRCIQSERLPVIGYVPARGNSIAALRLGRCEGKTLRYVGKAGTGFSSAQSVRGRLEPLMRRTVPKLRKKGIVWADFACAVGPAGRVAALDISGPMLAEGAARAKAAGIINIDWRQADPATA